MLLLRQVRCQNRACRTIGPDQQYVWNPRLAEIVKWQIIKDDIRVRGGRLEENNSTHSHEMMLGDAR